MPPADAEEIAPATPTELSRILYENARGPKSPLLPVGGRTSLKFGNPSVAELRLVATAGLSKVIDYPARDMTITVEAGIRVSELQQLLAQEGQRLPIDIPDARRATIGGAIATNTSGPGRYGHGTFRDFLIGVSAVDGRGRFFSAGGRVVKNVAGYDLCKVLVGSLGTLGVMTQVTLKLRPLAETRQITWIRADDLTQIEVAIVKLTSSAARPVAVELLNGRAARAIRAESKIEVPTEGYSLLVAMEGAAREVAWQTDQLRTELAAIGMEPAAVLVDTPAEAVWDALVEFQAASDDPVTFAASVPPSRTVEFVRRATEANVSIQAHAGNGIIIGHLPDRCVDAPSAAALIGPLRDLAQGFGGSLVLWSCEESWKPTCGVFGTPAPAARWMTRVKTSLDPDNLLAPGRSLA